MENNTAETKAANDGSVLHTLERSAGDTADRIKEAVNAGMVEAEGAIHSAKDYLHTTQQRAGEGFERAKVAAANAGNAMADAGAYAGHKAEVATNRVGGAMEETGHYLKNDGLQHIGKDLTELIRRNPVPAMLIGVGCGFLLAQASTRRNA